MSYTNETTYYGLPLPTGSDKSTFTDNNTAFQAVDAALHTAYEQSGAATEDIVAIKATVANLIQADIDFQSDLDTEKGKIRNLQDKEVLQDAAIAEVKADAFDMITAYNEPTATSAHAYSVGDYFIYNDVLYQATEAIAIGDTIVPDTNCTTTNVASELAGINSDLNPLDFEKTDTQTGSYYSLSFKRKGHICSFDGVMTLVDPYPADTDLIDVSDTDFRPSLGQAIMLYNQTANTSHLAYLSGSGAITAVTSFTAGRYIISATYLT